MYFGWGIPLSSLNVDSRFRETELVRPVRWCSQAFILCSNSDCIVHFGSWFSAVSFAGKKGSSPSRSAEIVPFSFILGFLFRRYSFMLLHTSTIGYRLRDTGWDCPLKSPAVPPVASRAGFCSPMFVIVRWWTSAFLSTFLSGVCQEVWLFRISRAQQLYPYDKSSVDRSMCAPTRARKNQKL